MPLTDYLKSTLDTVVQKAIEQGTPNFHLAASEILAEKQFDLLLSAARGFHALAIKYKLNPMLAKEYSEAHDSLLKVLGLLPEEYSAEKERLEMKLEGKLKKDKTDEEVKQLKSLYRDKIYAKRVELKVEAYASNLYKKLESEQGYNLVLKKRFKLHLEDNWVEDDLESLQKQNYETKNEYKIRKKLNKHLERYHQMRQPYEDSTKEIEDEFEQAREQCLRKGKTENGLSVEQAIHLKYQELDEKSKDIESQNTRAQTLVKQMLEVKVVKLKSKEAMMEAIESNKQSLLKRYDEEVVNRVYQLVEPNLSGFLELLDNTELSSERGFLWDELSEMAFDICSSHYAQQLNHTEKEINEQLAVIYEPVADELSALHAQKRQKLEQLDIDSKRMLMDANNYYDKEIGYRKRLLKCEQLNKMFAVQADCIPDLLDDMTVNEPTVDAQTLAFIVSMQEATRFMKIMSSLVQVGGEVMINLVSKDETSFETPEKTSSFVDDVVSKVVRVIDDKERALLGSMRVEEQQVFDHITQRMLDCSQMNLPIELEENDYVPTLLDFMPKEAAPPIEQYDQKDFFDYVQEYQQSSNVGKLKFFYQFYHDLSQENPELCLEDYNDPALTLLNSLEDEASAVLINLLPVIERAYGVIQSHAQLSSKQNKQITSILEQIVFLKNRRIELNEKFQMVLEMHQEQRVVYQRSNEQLTQTEQKVNSLQGDMAVLKKQMKDKKLEFSKKQNQIRDRILHKQSSHEYTSQLERIESSYEASIQKLEQQYEKDLKHINQRHDSDMKSVRMHNDIWLEGFDERTQDEINGLIQAAYAKQQSKLSYVYGSYVWHLFAAKMFSQKQLDDLLKDSDDLELKKSVDAVRVRRADEREKYELVDDEQLEELEQYFADGCQAIMQKFQHDQQTLLQRMSDDKLLVLQSVEHDEETLQNELDALKIKYQDEMSSLEVKAHSVEEELSMAQEQRKEQREELIGLSRSYYHELEEFKRDKSKLQKDANILIQEALDIEPDGQQDLMAARLIIGEVNLFAQHFLHIAGIKNAVLDQKELHQLDRNQIMRHHEHHDPERQVREISPVSSEHGIVSRGMLNANKLASRSLVANFCKAPLNAARLYAQHLNATILAEQKMDEQQKQLDQLPYAKKSELQNALTTKPTPNPYQYSKLELFAKNISQSISFFAHAFIKGFAYASINKIASSLMLPGAISKGEHEVDVMFTQLQSISHIEHRQNALEKIGAVLNIMDDKSILNSVYRERFEVERIKQGWFEAIENQKKKNNSDLGWKHIFQVSSANARLNLAIKDIQPIESFVELSNYMKTVKQDQKELFDIVKSFKKELAEKIGTPPKPDTRSGLRR